MVSFLNEHLKKNKISRTHLHLYTPACPPFSTAKDTILLRYSTQKQARPPSLPVPGVVLFKAEIIKKNVRWKNDNNNSAPRSHVAFVFPEIRLTIRFYISCFLHKTPSPIRFSNLRPHPVGSVLKVNSRVPAKLF